MEADMSASESGNDSGDKLVTSYKTNQDDSGTSPTRVLSTAKCCLVTKVPPDPISTHLKQIHTLPPTASDFFILVPPVERRWEYQVYQDENEVQDIIEEYEELGELHYLVKFREGRETEVSGLSNYSLNTTINSCLIYSAFRAEANEYWLIGIIYSTSNPSEGPKSSQRVQYSDIRC